MHVLVIEFLAIFCESVDFHLFMLLFILCYTIYPSVSYSTLQSDKSDVDVERIKATLMLCYGYVALFSPPTLIISRMEATILRSLTPHFENVKVSKNK